MCEGPAAAGEAAPLLLGGGGAAAAARMGCCAASSAPAAEADWEPPTRYISAPRPPPHLWDTANSQYLDMVRCHAMVRVVSLDPKMGTFTVRMKCHWAFRTLNSQEDSELHLRGVPGIRMPALKVTVEESRVWKDLTNNAGKGTSNESVFWRGTSTFTIDGFKVFHMENFPFDRQVINLEQLDFVWRPEKDAADYYKSMKVVSFVVRTTSLLPEWDVTDPYICKVAKSETVPSDRNCPCYAHKFIVKLRIERRQWFYVRQVFFVAYLMALVSCTPLTMPPTEDNMGTRLEVYGSSMLTLVAFKYAVADHLPSVPYKTFTDDFLLAPVITVSLCVFETVMAYQFMDGASDEEIQAVDNVENSAYYVVALLWTLYFLYAAFWKPWHRTLWKDVMEHRDQYSLRSKQSKKATLEFFELDNPYGFEEEEELAEDLDASPETNRNQPFTPKP